MFLLLFFNDQVFKFNIEVKTTFNIYNIIILLLLFFFLIFQINSLIFIQNGILSSLPYLGKYVMAILAGSIADNIVKANVLSKTTIRKIFTALGNVNLFLLLYKNYNFNALHHQLLSKSLVSFEERMDFSITTSQRKRRKILNCILFYKN